MKKFIFTILFVAVISFAIELCNSGAFEIQAPVGSCANEGYVCNVATDQNGGIMFKLGKDTNCIEIDTTMFTTYPIKSTMGLCEKRTKTLHDGRCFGKCRGFGCIYKYGFYHKCP